jgi:C_GCAxxG_C_C family probable redox protein
MSRIEEAASYFKGNCNCTQAVLCSFSTQFELDKDKGLKIATGFGGGMGGLGRTCGAATGAYMVIGLKHGMGINEDINAKGKTAQLVKEFTNRFEKMYGSVMCKELLECDISTPEGKEYFAQNDLFEKKCLPYVKFAVETLEELL